MVEIDGIQYEYKKFARLKDIAYALIDKPISSFNHFTMVCHKNKVISIGYNDVSASPAKINGKHIHYKVGGRHSEVSAIKKIRNLDICKECNVVNIRLNNNGELRMAKPCSVCHCLLSNLRFKKVYYSTDSGFDCLNLR